MQHVNCPAYFSANIRTENAHIFHMFIEYNQASLPVKLKSIDISQKYLCGINLTSSSGVTKSSFFIVYLFVQNAMDGYICVTMVQTG